MTIPNVAQREALSAMSKAIERGVRSEDPTLFFAAFLELGDGVVYLSNGDRPEIQRLLPALVAALEGSMASTARAPRSSLSSAHTDARLAVERICADVGKRLTREGRVALFVFKNDADCPDGTGVNAYFSSLPDAPRAIRLWLARAKA